MSQQIVPLDTPLRIAAWAGDARRGWTRRFAAAGRLACFAGWAIGTTLLIGSLMAPHWLPLPALNTLPGTATKIAWDRTDCWHAIHVLATDCPCSRSVGDYLVRRGPVCGVDESILIIGPGADDLAGELRARKYLVRRTTSERVFEDLAVRGGPWLVLIDPKGQTRYSGGYASRRPRPGVAYQDLDLLRRLQSGEEVAPYAAFGCAIDPALKRAMNPLGYKSL